MSWRLAARPQVDADVTEAATWYEDREPGLGVAFMEEIFRVWDELADNPLLNSRRVAERNIRWRWTRRFPYRVVYEVDEERRSILVIAVLHSARHHRHWQRRL
jgi:plasmid stabilization system protein ParE